MFDAQVDLITPNGGEGEVYSTFKQGGSKLNVGAMRPFVDFNPKTRKWESYISVFSGGNAKDLKNYRVIPLQNNATLRREEWKSLDDAIMMVARDRLTGVNDLISKGLTYNLNNALGTTIFEWHDVGDSMEAIVSMDGVTRGQGDRPKFQHNYIPIPIIHVDYEINTRVLEASRNMGNPLDATSAENAARRVAEKLEDMLFTDTTYSYGETDSRSRNSIYSYINFPDKNDYTITAWDASGKTGAQIIADCLGAKQMSINKKHYGPWTMYLPTNYETVIDADYDATTPGTTIRERILKISGIDEVKIADHLPDDNIVMVEMKSSTVRLINGLAMQNIEWKTEGNWVNKYKVVAIQVPQIRSDQNGACGIVHMAPTV